ncbi:MAG: hypothetical protein S4CHLAM20_05540 [Chlamydiia bacterium]|nr:hypothetical protein [Chlamydiia bacterium]
MLRTKSYTPLFNTPNFESVLINNPVDNVFHIRILETIIFPGRSVKLAEEKNGVCKVQTEDYYGEKFFFTKNTFLEEGRPIPKRKLPDLDIIIKRLYSFPKMPYLLGGACLTPIEMNLMGLDAFDQRHKKLYGIDCSGLLYFVTHGHTPRNTSELINYGMRVNKLKPMDLIVLQGHVLIYLGNGDVIESLEVDGVVISKWEIRKKKIKKEYRFIRFHPQAF